MTERVLITGASGLLGSALKEELAAVANYHVCSVSSADADLRDPRATRDLFGRLQPNVVFHLAARVGGLGGNSSAPGEYFYDNILINTHVIEASRLVGVRKIVAIGSAAVYSDSVQLPMRETDIWLGPPHGSEAAYAHAKRAMLAHLEAYRLQYGIAYAYCVLTNVYGPNDWFSETSGHVVPSLLSKFDKADRIRGSVTVWGTGSARRDFMFSKDAARALRLVAERIEGAVNVASGRVVSIRELVETIKDVSGFAGRIVWDSNMPNGQELRDYDVIKLKEAGFLPSYDLRQGLAETFAWLRTHADRARR